MKKKKGGRKREEREGKGEEKKSSPPLKLRDSYHLLGSKLVFLTGVGRTLE